jgi:hypothetical protein
MSFTSDADIKDPFEPLPATVELAAVAVQATDHDEIDSQSLAHVPPDGGLHAWLKVLGGFLIYSNIWYNSSHTPTQRPRIII